METFTKIELIAIWSLPVLFAIVIHEVSHGYVAKYYGDNTAYAQGRLTLNPLKHVDIMGTVVVPILLFFSTGFVFGWAKPVPVSPKNLRNPIRDMAVVAAAGPIVNFIMALGWALIIKLGLLLSQQQIPVAAAVVEMGRAGILVNLILGLINLVPIPPLDGSRVVSSFLPKKAFIAYNKIEPFGFFIVLGLMLAGVFSYLLLPPLNFLYSFLLTWIVGV